MRTSAPARQASFNRPGSAGVRRATGSAAPLALAGARAAFSAAGLGLAVVAILVVLGWIAAPRSGLGLLGAMRAAAVIWLAGHHVAVQIAGAGRIGLLPLGFVLLPGALLWRAGRSVVRGHGGTGPRQVIKVALAVAVPYSLLAGVLAVISTTGLASASALQAVPAAFAAALVAAGFGAARALAPWAQLGAHLTARTRSVLVGAAGSLSVLAAAGCLATAMALAGHASQFTAVYTLLDPGVVGTGLLLLAQLGYLPNAVLWAVAYMLGPGFAVGSGTVVAPTGSVLGPLPAFPLLAALPAGTQGSASAWLAGLVLAMPYLAGVVGGLLVMRQAPATALEAAPLRGFCVGAVAGAVLGVLTAFAGGPLGDGRLAVVGPSAWQVGLLATLEVGIAAAVTAGAANWRGIRSLRAEQREVGQHRTGQPGGRPSSAPGSAVHGGPGTRTTAPHTSSRDSPDGHVIYLDSWTSSQDDSAVRRRGPSALP